MLLAPENGDADDHGPHGEDAFDVVIRDDVAIPTESTSEWR